MSRHLRGAVYSSCPPVCAPPVFDCLRGFPLYVVSHNSDLESLPTVPDLPPSMSVRSETAGRTPDSTFDEMRDTVVGGHAAGGHRTSHTETLTKRANQASAPLRAGVEKWLQGSRSMLHVLCNEITTRHTLLDI